MREIKKSRDALNAQITEKISEIKKERPKKVEKKAAPTDARGRPIKPAMLKRQIKAMEEKLETVPMDFKAEQKMTKTMKAMQKQLEQMEGVSGLTGELAKKSKEIDALKKEANQLHAQVTEMAKQSQDYHEKMLKLSEEIEDLKKNEEDAYQEFLKHKEAYVKVAGDVKVVQTEAKKAKAAKRARDAEEKKRKEAEDQKTLKERAKEAEEKMKKGKKLSTEDLLALQGVKE